MNRSNHDIQHYGGRPCLDGFRVWLDPKDESQAIVLCNPSEGGSFTLSIAEFKQTYSIHEKELEKAIYVLLDASPYVKLGS